MGSRVIKFLQRVLSTYVTGPNRGNRALLTHEGEIGEILRGNKKRKIRYSMGVQRPGRHPGDPPVGFPSFGVGSGRPFRTNLKILTFFVFLFIFKVLKS